MLEDREAIDCPRIIRDGWGEIRDERPSMMGLGHPVQEVTRCSNFRTVTSLVSRR